MTLEEAVENLRQSGWHPDYDDLPPEVVAEGVVYREEEFSCGRECCGVSGRFLSLRGEEVEWKLNQSP